MSFVHLHRHSEWSLLDGVGDGEMWAAQAEKLGQSSLAITDHGSLTGVLYHAEACEAHNIKPIFGMEAYFRPDIKKDREEHNRYGYYHLVLLAKNKEGFKNLMRITSESYTEKYFYQKPNVDWNLLNRYKDGLIASSSCVSGYAPNRLLMGMETEAREYIDIMRKMFKDDFYLETQPHVFPEQQMVNRWMVNLSLEKGIPLVATADAHYPYEDWAKTQDILLMINTGQSTKSRDDADAEKKEYMKFDGSTYYLMSADEIKSEFKKNHEIPDDLLDEMIYNSVVIDNKIDHIKYDKSPKVPKATETPEEAEKILREWCKEGLERIGKSSESEYITRVDEELEVIRTLKVLDFFVIVADMVRWAKEQDIRVGAGRGSAAGSLVNYLIGITAVDPIGYGLLFERFLNEYRTEIPDIDIDFQSDKRDLVKDYLRKKWGSEQVVSIAAFQSFGLKSVVQDVARVLNVSLTDTLKATDSIPTITFGETIESMELSLPNLRKYFEKYPEVREHAVRLQGQIKNQSKHAAGVVVTDRPAQELIPMMRAKDGSMITQWSERANAQLISPYGFLKIDLLATIDLTTQDMTCKLIKERHGVDIDFEDVEQFEITESPYKGEIEVVEAFGKGMNLGIFQFGGSRGITNLLRDIKPDNLEHIIAANALYRPGTLTNGVAFEYGRRKNGKGWKLVDPIVEPFVGTTYGLIVYQEQVMQMYRALGEDVLPSEAAVFLKVVAKGIARDLEGRKKLEPFFDKFSRGCKARGIDEEVYKEIWSQILQMTTYAFNKSHSTGYAVQAYQDMWLKVHYPLEFYTCLLTTEEKKTASIIREARVQGITILPPDINVSDEGFTIDGDSIRFGLFAVKHLGPAAVSEIMEKRPFTSYSDLEERCEKRKINSKVKRSLLKSGALDAWGMRNDIIAEEKAEGEKEIIGFTLSRASDMERHKHVIESRAIPSYKLEEMDGGTVFVGGEIISVKEIKTKKGDPMAFVDLSFGANEYSLTFFPETYDRYIHILSEGNAIVIKGEWEADRQQVIVMNAVTAQALAEAETSAS